MAGVSPMLVASAVATAAAGAKTVSDQNARTNAQERVQKNRVDSINAQNAAEERKRKDELKRLNARHVARFSALGISPGEGSSAAVLDGLKQSSVAAAEERAVQAELARQRVELSATPAAGKDLLGKSSSSDAANIAALLSSD